MMSGIPNAWWLLPGAFHGNACLPCDTCHASALGRRVGSHQAAGMHRRLHWIGPAKKLQCWVNRLARRSPAQHALAHRRHHSAAEALNSFCTVMGNSRGMPGENQQLLTGPMHPQHHTQQRVDTQHMHVSTACLDGRILPTLHHPCPARTHLGKGRRTRMGLGLPSFVTTRSAPSLSSPSIWAVAALSPALHRRHTCNPLARLLLQHGNVTACCCGTLRTKHVPRHTDAAWCAVSAT